MEASSSNPPPMSYDIFLSFRGEDTRNTFIGYLYKELHQLGIMTFKDDNSLLIGDNISNKLVRAIEKSRSSIVVLSKDYASSKWCLRELAKIIDCMVQCSHRVLPVFYHVDPSDVRHQSGSFKKCFDEYEETLQQFMNYEQKEEHEVQQWREAMTKIANLTGVVVTKESVEVASIDKITKQVFDMLHYPKLVAADKLNNLVDIERRLYSMDTLIGLESNDVCFVGIIGMGGIGKTTIAEVFYDKVAHKFGKNRCFLRIQGHSLSLISLQHQLLSQLLRKEDIKIMDENEGEYMIKYHLSGKKVLIVLDGIDEKGQLEKLAGSPDWFGPKSQIIITTRNRDVLRQSNYKDKLLEYKVELLDYKSGFSLFCKHAFGDHTCPNENFEQLSKEIVDRVKGHPQALVQIGSYLYGQDIDVWKEELNSLDIDYNKHVFKTLKISFDGLEKTSQQVFLDLACFFNGRRKDKVIEILRSFDYRPHSEIQLLYDRCLIEVRRDGTIFIPNCIQTMGRKIERDADERSRIWIRKDVLDVFDKRHGVKHIEGIVLDLEEKQDKLKLQAGLFEDMTGLRILEIGNVEFCEDFTHLSKQLRLLNWHGYPSTCLPLQFESRYLFELLLPVGQNTQLWKGQKGFEKLKVIDVSDSRNLRETPNFTKVPNLESLVLRNCTRLYMIDHSISRLNRLTSLDLTCCVSLRSFSVINSCKSLTTLKLAGSGLERLKGVDNTYSPNILPPVKRRPGQLPIPSFHSISNFRE
ncbi:TMV resistance protein N-like isoform X2 [Momordica charantia]|uniref:TMV resistance protein N-like isoform X2 n=1 Tax=Momordica charantia TaxID=3673 RepID=A0A6J1CK85_MOMCH|nr:TMV resistance protein N-like isoform X2 [Momordica charantia]